MSLNLTVRAVPGGVAAGCGGIAPEVRITAVTREANNGQLNFGGSQQQRFIQVELQREGFEGPVSPAANH
jgi:hypothetical protein